MHHALLSLSVARLGAVRFTKRSGLHVTRRLGQIPAAIEQGVITASTKDRLLELESQRDRLAAQLAGVPTAVHMRLHPNLAEVYRRKVAELEVALNAPEDRAEAHTVLRGLIERIVLHPGTKRGELAAEMHGEIVALWQLADDKEKNPYFGRSTGLVGCGDMQPALLAPSKVTNSFVTSSAPTRFCRL